MATQNVWNNQVIDAAVTFNGGTMNIGSDATDNAINVGTNANAGRTVTVGNAVAASTTNVNCGTGGATFGTSANVHTTQLGSTSGASATTVQSGSGALNITSANGILTINSGTANLNISNDAVATTVNIATGVAVKSVTLGSNDTTSQTIIQSGTNGLNINSNNGGLVINSGTGALSISNDASATTVNIASGGAAKVVQLGSTNGASSLALRYGTADFTLASATGTTMSVLDTGEITEPLQPAFLAKLPTQDLNVTGNGAGFVVGSATAMTEIFDQNADFNVNGTFTAPVTGRFQFNAYVYISGCTIASAMSLNTSTSNRGYGNFFYRVASAQPLSFTSAVLADMDAGDTAHIEVASYGEAGNTDDVGADAWFSGYLVC